MALSTPTARGNGVGTTSAVTGSFTPSANALLIASVFARQNTTVPAQPTISDTTGLTWTEIKDQQYDPGSNPRARGRMFWAQVGGSPASMTVTGSVSGASNTFIIVDEYTGAGTTDFTNAIGVGNAAGDPTVTLPNGAPTSTSSFHVHGWFGANNTIDNKAGWTELLDAQAGATTNRLYSVYDHTSAPSSLAATSSNGVCLAIGVEIKEAGSAAITGTASGSLDFTGSAAGTVAIVGTVSGSLAFTGSSAAVVAITGTGTGSLDLTGSAAGSVAIAGSAVGELDLSGATVGVVPITGAVAGDFPIEGAGQGSVAVLGVVTGDIEFTGEASGASGQFIVGTVQGVLTITGFSQGRGPRRATVARTYRPDYQTRPTAITTVRPRAISTGTR